MAKNIRKAISPRKNPDGFPERTVRSQVSMKNSTSVKMFRSRNI